MYKYEMHLHSSRCSACAISTAAEQVERLYEAGYAGAVFTNHFYRGNSAVDRNIGWENFVGVYRDDYLEAKKLGESLGLDILFGVEHGYSAGKEVLIYGLEPEHFINEPDFKDYDLARISQFVRKNGGFIACAHPFRQAVYIPEPDVTPDPFLIDGVESYNRGNADNEWNIKAARFAQENNLVTISGGDCHLKEQIGFAGIAAKERITDSKKLVKILKARQHRLIINGEIV